MARYGITHKSASGAAEASQSAETAGLAFFAACDLFRQGEVIEIRTPSGRTNTLDEFRQRLQQCAPVD